MLPGTEPMPPRITITNACVSGRMPMDGDREKIGPISAPAAPASAPPNPNPNV